MREIVDDFEGGVERLKVAGSRLSRAADAPHFPIIISRHTDEKFPPSPLVGQVNRPSTHNLRAGHMSYQADDAAGALLPARRRYSPSVAHKPQSAAKLSQ